MLHQKPYPLWYVGRCYADSKYAARRSRYISKCRSLIVPIEYIIQALSSAELLNEISRSSPALAARVQYFPKLDQRCLPLNQLYMLEHFRYRHQSRSKKVEYASSVRLGSELDSAYIMIHVWIQFIVGICRLWKFAVSAHRMCRQKCPQHGSRLVCSPSVLRAADMAV